jgi:hypothetical protein
MDGSVPDGESEGVGLVLGGVLEGGVVLGGVVLGGVVLGGVVLGGAGGLLGAVVLGGAAGLVGAVVFLVPVAGLEAWVAGWVAGWLAAAAATRVLLVPPTAYRLPAGVRAPPTVRNGPPPLWMRTVEAFPRVPAADIPFAPGAAAAGVTGLPWPPATAGPTGELRLAG